MAAIDSLLTLIDAQQATGIVLRAREIPVLVSGKGRGLTMPPLDFATIETFAVEVLTADELETLRLSGACDTVYRCAKGTFTVEARLSGDNMSLKLRRGGAQVAKPVAPAPVAPAPVAPAAPGTPPTQVAAPAQVEASPTAVATTVEPAEPAVEDPARAAVAARLAGVIARAAGHEVSDIVISAGQPLWIKSTAGFAAASAAAISETEIRAFADSILDPPRRRVLENAGSVDLPWVAPDIDDGPQRFRVNVFTQAHGLANALRPINRQAPSFAELNLPDSIGGLAGVTSGMVLVVGQAGAGKSSTLAAMVETVNRTCARHVITLEDPIEFAHHSKTCVVNQRQVRKHTGSFASALRAALREDPDVIAIGELRDLETISLAITAAETGHLVLGTLHTNDAARTINRILDAYPPDQQSQIRAMISESLRAIVSQKLVPTVDGSRRVPALEILLVNIAVSNLIREERVFQLRSVMQTGRNLGMRLFDDSLLELVRAGTISKETARKQCDDPKLFA